jgi:hypothetical protein
MHNIAVFHIFQTLPATISLCYASIKETYCRLAFYLQVLNSYSKFVIIPRKLMIGKRLSQCMHPALTERRSSQSIRNLQPAIRAYWQETLVARSVYL